MKIPSEHLTDVCGLGRKAGTCAFITVGGAGFECAKGLWTEQLIRIRLRDMESNALADNCSGPPDFTPTQPEERQ